MGEDKELLTPRKRSGGFEGKSRPLQHGSLVAYNRAYRGGPDRRVRARRIFLCGTLVRTQGAFCLPLRELP